MTNNYEAFILTKVTQNVSHWNNVQKDKLNYD